MSTSELSKYYAAALLLHQYCPNSLIAHHHHPDHHRRYHLSILGQLSPRSDLTFHMPDLHTPLVSPFAKLDIKDILKDSPSPPPRTTPAPAYSRSISVPSSYTQLAPLHSPSSSSSLSRYSTSTAPPNPPHRHQSHPAQQLTLQPAPPLSNTAQAVFQQNPNLNPAAASNKRSSPGGKHTSGPTTKGKGKWSPDEDAKIIVLRGRGMKWENISKEFPGRSAISCRLHYQNYLEKRADWDEEKRNKLARVYDR